MRGQGLAELDEGADDVDAHGNGTGAIEDVGGHEGTVFGEGVGQVPDIAFRCGHNL